MGMVSQFQADNGSGEFFYVDSFNLAYIVSVGQTMLAFSLFLLFSVLRGSCGIHSDYYTVSERLIHSSRPKI